MPGTGSPVDHCRHAEGMQQGEAGFPPQIPVVPDLGASADPAKPRPLSEGLAVPRPAQMWPGCSLGPGCWKGAVWDHLGQAPSGADPWRWPGRCLCSSPCPRSVPEGCWPMPEPGHGSCWSQPSDWNSVLTVDLFILQMCLETYPAGRAWLPSLGQLCLPCSALPTPLTLQLLMTFPCCANPLWLHTPPAGSNSHLLLKMRDVSLQDGFRNYLIMHKNSFYISKVHF